LRLGVEFVGAVGGFFAMSLDTVVLKFKPPFAWREFLIQNSVCGTGADRRDD
jgi:hypothetical protein